MCRNQRVITIADDGLPGGLGAHAALSLVVPGDLPMELLIGCVGKAKHEYIVNHHHGLEPL
jgi:hypothetical protein